MWLFGIITHCVFTQANQLHVSGTIRAPSNVSMPLQAPSREDAFHVRVLRSATMGIAAPDGEGGNSSARAIEALQDDMVVYAELNHILGDEDLDEPTAGECTACKFVLVRQLCCKGVHACVSWHIRAHRGVRVCAVSCVSVCCCVVCLCVTVYL